MPLLMIILYRNAVRDSFAQKRGAGPAGFPPPVRWRRVSRGAALPALLPFACPRPTGSGSSRGSFSPRAPPRVSLRGPPWGSPEGARSTRFRGTGARGSIAGPVPPPPVKAPVVPDPSSPRHHPTPPSPPPRPERGAHAGTSSAPRRGSARCGCSAARLGELPCARERGRHWPPPPGGGGGAQSPPCRRRGSGGGTVSTTDSGARGGGARRPGLRPLPGEPGGPRSAPPPPHTGAALVRLTPPHSDTPQRRGGAGGGSSCGSCWRGGAVCRRTVVVRPSSAALCPYLVLLPPDFESVLSSVATAKN